VSDDNIPGLRHLFGASPEPTIDLAAVTRRSRARRLPKVLGIGVAGALAIGGVSVIGVQYGLGDPGTVTALSLQDTGESGALPGAAFNDDSSSGLQSGYDNTKRSAASQLNWCGFPVVDQVPNNRGLTLRVAFSAASAESRTIVGTVTLTNDGSETITGYTANQPTITVSEAGIVRWHSAVAPTGPDVSVLLEPGESMTYPASFTAVRCGIDDDISGKISDDLPLLSAGVYQVSAAIDVMGDADAELVMSAPFSVTLK
jgi:hypothetical protein